MKQVFILAEKFQHIKNWARFHDINLAANKNIKWAETTKTIRGVDREGYFIVITWPANGSEIINMLESREYTNIPVDINEWPLDAFIHKSY